MNCCHASTSTNSHALLHGCQKEGEKTAVELSERFSLIVLQVSLNLDLLAYTSCI